jgi:hypothetical protein
MAHARRAQQLAIESQLTGGKCFRASFLEMVQQIHAHGRRVFVRLVAAFLNEA